MKFTALQITPAIVRTAVKCLNWKCPSIVIYCAVYICDYLEWCFNSNVHLLHVIWNLLNSKAHIEKIQMSWKSNSTAHKEKLHANQKSKPRLWAVCSNWWQLDKVCLFTVECFLLDCALFVVCMCLTMFMCENILKTHTVKIFNTESISHFSNNSVLKYLNWIFTNFIIPIILSHIVHLRGEKTYMHHWDWSTQVLKTAISMWTLQGLGLQIYMNRKCLNSD